MDKVTAMKMSDEMKMHRWMSLCEKCGMGYTNAHCDDILNNKAFDTLVEEYYVLEDYYALQQEL